MQSTPRSIAKAVLGVFVALAVTEALFRVRDGGAFPLVNIYERDDQCGVRLRPDETTRVGRPGERTTSVRTNAEGFRGAAWPAPSEGEIVVLGDSLSFGLGVEEDERFSAVLERESGTPVLDASVPTYGPPEYLVVLERLLARRRPQLAIVTLNLLNDLSELGRPNSARHTAVDGWAARALGDERPGTSPLRELAIRSSHAAFALWRWDRTRAAAAPQPPRIDEIQELISIAAESRNAESLRAERRDHLLGAETELGAATAERAAAEVELVAVAGKARGLVAYTGALSDELGAYVRGGGEPRDEVFELNYGGCAPPAPGYSYRYRTRFAGERIRSDVEALLRDFGSRLHGELGKQIAAAFARRDAADARLARARETPAGPPVEPLPPLAIEAFLRDAIAGLLPTGIRLVVLVAPLDAQIHERARTLRGLSRESVQDLDALVARLVTTTRALGADAVDPTLDLRRLGEAAYLADGHLSPAGHGVMAGALLSR